MIIDWIRRIKKSNKAIKEINEQKSIIYKEINDLEEEVDKLKKEFISKNEEKIKNRNNNLRKRYVSELPSDEYTIISENGDAPIQCVEYKNCEVYEFIKSLGFENADLEIRDFDMYLRYKKGVLFPTINNKDTKDDGYEFRIYNN